MVGLVVLFSHVANTTQLVGLVVVFSHVANTTQLVGLVIVFSHVANTTQLVGLVVVFSHEADSAQLTHKAAKITVWELKCEKGQLHVFFLLVAHLSYVHDKHFFMSVLFLLYLKT